MADNFGVSVQFINNELARFISEGQIHAKIDRVGWFDVLLANW